MSHAGMGLDWPVGGVDELGIVELADVRLGVGGVVFE